MRSFVSQVRLFFVATMEEFSQTLLHVVGLLGRAVVALRVLA